LSSALGALSSRRLRLLGLHGRAAVRQGGRAGQCELLHRPGLAAAGRLRSILAPGCALLGSSVSRSKHGRRARGMRGCASQVAEALATLACWCSLLV